MLPGFATPDGFERFRAKAGQFFKAHEDHVTIYKLRTNEPLTSTDLSELERILTESGIGTAHDVAKAKTECKGLGLFVGPLVGLDRQATKKALGGFLDCATFGTNQIQFLDEIVNHLTEHGCMEAARRYESPYTDLSPQGVDGLFSSEQVDKIISILDESVVGRCVMV